MTDNRNTILAVVLSGLVLIAWQYFYNVPQMEKQRALQQAQSELVKPTPQAGNTASPSTAPQTGSAPPPPRAPPPSASAPPPNTQPAVVVSREAAIADTNRVKIDTPRVSGSISLK